MANHIRRPFVTALDTAQRAAATTAVKQAGQSWPCVVTAVSGSIVTVSFQVKTPWTLQTMKIPLFGPEWIRYPIQVGTRGFAISASTTLGHMSGLGGSAPPDVSTPPNLSSLVFMPIGNVGWTAPHSANVLELYGPDGVFLHDTASNSTVTIAPDGITVQHGANVLTINDSGITIQAATINLIGNVNLQGTLSQTGESGGASTATFNGVVTAQSVIAGNGVHLETHTHPGDSGGTTGAPNADT